MTHATQYLTETGAMLWRRAAALLAAFVEAHLPALRFARMREAPLVFVRDALTRLRRIETLARRILFAQALGVRVTKRPARPTGARPTMQRGDSAPLNGDPSSWRVRFSVPLPPAAQTRSAVRQRDRGEPRHPLLLRPDRLPRLPQPQRPYDPVAAARWRERARDRKDAAWRAYWMAPWPPVKEEGPAYIEIPPANEPTPMQSTLALARRMEAPARVIADPAPYARRLAARLARRPARAGCVLARWESQTRRTLFGAETLQLARRHQAVARDDTS